MNMRELPKVSIVISARNEERYLGECLESIAAQTYPHELIELLLVDSASEDRTRDIMEDFARKADINVKILSNPRGDTPRGLNTGIKAATGELIMFMSAHSYMPENHIERAVKILYEKDADGVSCRLKSIGSGMGKVWDDVIAAAMESPVGLGNVKARVGRKAGWVDNPMFALYRRELFERFGYLDERLTRNQDYEFNQRCYQGGARFWFQPDLVVYYHNRPTLRALWRQYFNSAFWRAFMVGQFGRAIRLRHLVPPAFVVVLVLSALFALVSKFWLSVFLCIFGLYIITIILGAAIEAVKRRKARIFPLLPIAFATIHFAFGVGMIAGLVKFVLLGKRKYIKAAVKQ